MQYAHAKQIAAQTNPFMSICAIGLLACAGAVHLQLLLQRNRRGVRTSRRRSRLESVGRDDARVGGHDLASARRTATSKCCRSSIADRTSTAFPATTARLHSAAHADDRAGAARRRAAADDGSGDEGELMDAHAHAAAGHAELEIPYNVHPRPDTGLYNGEARHLAVPGLRGHAVRRAVLVADPAADQAPIWPRG